jgi:hypothetical protein
MLPTHDNSGLIFVNIKIEVSELEYRYNEELGSQLNAATNMKLNTRSSALPCDEVTSH